MMIDTKLIAAHQWVIDETQKKPTWWAEQVIMGATSLDIVHKVLTWNSGWDAVMLLLILVITAMLVHATKNPVFFKSIGESKRIRMFFLSFVVYHCATLFLEKDLAMNLLQTISTMFMGSYYYFAACEDPKPPKRKEKLVPTLA